MFFSSTSRHGPAIEFRPIKQMTGQSGFQTKVFLTDVRIPDTQRFGHSRARAGRFALTTVDERAVDDRHRRHANRFSRIAGLLRNGSRWGAAKAIDAPAVARESWQTWAVRTSGLKHTAGAQQSRQLSKGEQPGAGKIQSASSWRGLPCRRDRRCLRWICRPRPAFWNGPEAADFRRASRGC